MPVGIGPKGMPRVPAVFRRKGSWRKLDPSVRNLDANNYSSAKDAYNSIRAKFKEDESEGRRATVLGLLHWVLSKRRLLKPL